MDQLAYGQSLLKVSSRIHQNYSRVPATQIELQAIASILRFTSTYSV